ncbi:MAG: transcription antitermination factor NusB [Thermoleophilia bacterium]|nr:transcription antitermination factor NusB [Thermoleophilia bacterium]
MPKGRRNARRQAVFLMYQQDLLGLTPEAALARVAEAELPPYTRELVLGIASKRASIDRILESRLESWSLDRLGILERSILRVAAYELLWRTDIPSAVAINEAVEIAKRFCGDEAGALVNGVLGRLVDEGLVPDRPIEEQPSGNPGDSVNSGRD